ncbi:MAG: tetratricopeptide repeat protein [Polyangiaceae bacterium]
MDEREARRSAIVRDSFLQLMPRWRRSSTSRPPAPAGESTGRWINELVEAYTAFTAAPETVLERRTSSRASSRCRLTTRSPDEFVACHRPAASRSFLLGREPRPDLARLRFLVEATWQRAGCVHSGGEERPVLATGALGEGHGGARRLLADYAADHPETLGLSSTRSVRALRADRQHRKHQRAVALADLVGARYDLGLALWQEQDRDGALQAFRAARSEAPDHAEAWHNEALVLRELGREGDARAAFERARATYLERLAESPGQPESLLWLAATEAALGESAEALRLLAAALELDPSLRETALSDPDLRELAARG